MSNKFYLYVGQYGNQLYVRDIKNGVESIFKTGFCPSLYVKSKSRKSEWTSIYDEPLDEIKFSDIRDAKEFVEQYKDVSNFEIHGMQNFQYQYINQKYPGEITYSLDEINIQTLDIETEVDDSGFPDIVTANMAINLVTMYDRKKKKAVTFSTVPFDINELSEEDKKHLDGSNLDVRVFKDEYTMLTKFVEYWSNNYPGIVTGWNTSKFDFPYICNRISRILGEDSVKKLSPFGIVKGRTVEIFGKPVQLFDIVGVIEADYLELFRKYTYGSQESYSLEYIASEELGVGKLEYDCTFLEFSKKYPSKFVAYNIIDCIRVDQLDEKMQLIDLLISITLLAKCNIKDTFGTVKPWDIFIFNHLANKKIAVPPHTRKLGGEFEGAWVKEPKTGMHGWTISFDFSSLYPTIIRQWNISPDTYIKNYREPITVNDVLTTKEGLSQYAHENDLCVAANGTFYSRKKMGFLPEIIAGTMAGRKIAKREMLALEQQYQSGGKTDHSLESRIAALDNRQMAFKILNNSLYGGISNAGFRYFELPMAEAITLTGQASDMHIEQSLNKFMNKALGTDNEDYVIAGDTDSVYVNVNPIVEKFYPGKDIDATVKWLDKFCSQAIQPIIDKSINHIFSLCNGFDKLMDMKREAIASKALWQKKKRYSMIVHNSEGVDYKPYKLKIMGLDMIKSSTPKVVRSELKDSLRIMFEGGEESLQKHVSIAKEKFMAEEPENIAFPRGVSDLNKWSDGMKQGEIKSGTPIHVRAAILYNQYKEKHETPIRNGDKIKFIYLKMPNPIRQDVIGFPATGKLPNRENLLKYIDWNTMFEKTFLSPLSGLTDACGWQHTKVASLEDFFG